MMDILRVILVISFAAVHVVAADAAHIEYERTGSCSVSIAICKLYKYSIYCIDVHVHDIRSKDQFSRFSQNRSRYSAGEC